MKEESRLGIASLPLTGGLAGPSGSIVVLDNGGYQVKASVVGSGLDPVRLPNRTAKHKRDPLKVFVADDEIDYYSDVVYTHSHDRGFVVNPEVQISVLERCLLRLGIHEPSSQVEGLLLTEHPFAPSHVKRLTDEIVFEQFCFNSCMKEAPQGLCSGLRKDASPGGFSAALVIDSGYSCTHVVPMVNDIWLRKATRRVDVGGKLLTNYLKEMLSFRNFNLMEDTHVIEQLKRDLCYVSCNFNGEMALARKRADLNPLWRDYVLPDFQTIHKGRVLERAAKGTSPSGGADQIAQTLRINTERISVPELLFSPMLVGLEQSGIPETIEQSLYACPIEVRKSLLENVVLVGGNVRLPGFKERLEEELRRTAPSDWNVKIRMGHAEPELSAWAGGVSLVETNFDRYRNQCVTRAEYNERGTSR